MSTGNLPKGFTIVELMVVLAVLVFLGAGITTVLTGGSNSYYTNMGLLDLQTSTRHAIDSMVTELRQSNSSDIQISSNQTSILFRVPINITTDPITYSSNITYYLNATSGRIMRAHPAGTEIILATDIDTLAFCCWNGTTCGTSCSNATLLEVILGAQTTVHQRALSFALKEKISLRR